MSIVKWTLLFAMFSHFQQASPLELAVVELPPVQQRGVASWYGNGAWHGQITANGELFDPLDYTCAHRSLPFDTMVLVENRTNGRRVWCRINDRGPFGLMPSKAPENEGELVPRTLEDNPRGILDMSWATAQALDAVEVGLQNVSLRYWSRAQPMGFNLAVLNP